MCLKRVGSVWFMSCLCMHITAALIACLHHHASNVSLGASLHHWPTKTWFQVTSVYGNGGRFPFDTYKQHAIPKRTQKFSCNIFLKVIPSLSSSWCVHTSDITVWCAVTSTQVIWYWHRRFSIPGISDPCVSLADTKGYLVCKRNHDKMSISAKMDTRTGFK